MGTWGRTAGWFSRQWQGAETLLAPRHCAGCDVVSGSSALCTACAAALVQLEQPEPRVSCDGVTRAAFRYADPVRRMVRAAKYGGNRSGLEILAVLAAARLFVPAWARPDLLLCVPLGPRRLAERGFNQSAVIAAALGERIGLSPSGGLVRIRETAPQVGRDESTRRNNVAGAFAWQGAPLNGARIWVIDDVCTTGATTAAAAAALRAAGCRSIDVAVAALVD